MDLSPKELLKLLGALGKVRPGNYGSVASADPYYKSLVDNDEDPSSVLIAGSSVAMAVTARESPARDEEAKGAAHPCRQPTTAAPQNL